MKLWSVVLMAVVVLSFLCAFGCGDDEGDKQDEEIEELEDEIDDLEENVADLQCWQNCFIENSGNDNSYEECLITECGFTE